MCWDGRRKCPESVWTRSLLLKYLLCGEINNDGKLGVVVGPCPKQVIKPGSNLKTKLSAHTHEKGNVQGGVEWDGRGKKLLAARRLFFEASVFPPWKPRVVCSPPARLFPHSHRPEKTDLI